jgi:hypothetical protein
VVNLKWKFFWPLDGIFGLKILNGIFGLKILNGIFLFVSSCKIYDLFAIIARLESNINFLQITLDWNQANFLNVTQKIGISHAIFAFKPVC